MWSSLLGTIRRSGPTIALPVARTRFSPLAVSGMSVRPVCLPLSDHSVSPWRTMKTLGVGIVCKGCAVRCVCVGSDVFCLRSNDRDRLPASGDGKSRDALRRNNVPGSKSVAYVGDLLSECESAVFCERYSEISGAQLSCGLDDIRLPAAPPASIGLYNVESGGNVEKATASRETKLAGLENASTPEATPALVLEARRDRRRGQLQVGDGSTG